MKYLILSELIRFKNWAIGICVLHLLALFFIHTVFGLLNNNQISLPFYAFIYIGVGLLLGFAQFASYRKDAQWTYLIHRPISTAKIFLSLLLAALILLVVTFTIPFLFLILSLDFLSNNLVELRHYSILVFTLMIALNFYLATCFAVLHPKRIALVVLLLPFIFQVSAGHGYWIFVNLAITMLGLSFIAYKAFKPDLTSNFDKPIAIFFSLIPMHAGIYMLSAYVLFMLGQILMFATGSHPFVDAKKDSYTQVTYDLNDSQSLNWGLRGADPEVVEMLTEQLKTAEFSQPDFSRRFFPNRQTRFQPYFLDMPQTFSDKTNRVEWTFNHQQMLFSGLTSKTKKFVGWLGIGQYAKSLATIPSSERFKDVPMVIAGFIATSDKLFQYDEQTQSIKQRFDLPEAEIISSILEPAGNIAVLFSDKNVYLFDKEQSFNTFENLTPFATVKFNDKEAELKRTLLAELSDGYLLGLTFASDIFKSSPSDGRMLVVKVGLDGSQLLLNKRTLGQSIASPLLYSDYFISPLHAFSEMWYENAIHPSAILKRIPSSIWLGIVMIFIVSITACCYMILTTTKSVRAKIGWIVGSSIMGLPGIVCCYFLSDWQRQKRIFKPDKPASDRLASP